MRKMTLKFIEFHKDNPECYRLFRKYAREASTKHKRYGARELIHIIRWYTTIETHSSDGFKINDHWSPYYARIFMFEFPALKGFFSLRSAIAEELSDTVIISDLLKIPTVGIRGI